MFGIEDTTFNDIRERSLFAWLDELEVHEDVAVRGGVKLTREYIAHLKQRIARLEAENALKADYMKRMVKKNKALDYYACDKEEREEL